MESRIGDRYKVVSQPAEDDPSGAWIALDNETNDLTSLHETVLSGGADEHKSLAEHVVRDVNLRRQINNPCVDRPIALAANNQTIVELIPHVNTNNLHAMVEETQAGMNVQDVIVWGAQLSRLLTSMHSMRPAITCCDLRPNNLLVGEDGVVRVADLDNIRFYRAGVGVDHEPETVRGYTAPEAFMNGADIDPRADIYQLGATLFHLATGESPTKHANRLKLPVASRVNPDVPEALSEIIAKATSLDPDDRYQTAEDLTIALEAVELAQDEGSGE
jgi:serine/threonine-protein kinase